MSLPNQGPSESQLPVGKTLPHRHSVLPRGGFTLPSGGPYKGQGFHFYDKYHWGLKEAVLAKEDEEKPGVIIKGENGDEKESAEQIAESTSEHDTTGETLLEDQGEPTTPPKHTSTRSPAHPKVAAPDFSLVKASGSKAAAVPDLSHMQFEGSTHAADIAAATAPMSLRKATRAPSTRTRTVVIPGSRSHAE